MNTKAFFFRTQGVKLVGVFGRPYARDSGRRFPAVLMLHGFPGAEKSSDIARALLLRGIGFLQLHSRGAWGSEGRFSFRTLVEDARAGLDFLASRDGVCRRRIGVFGFSMGGWTALHLAAAERRIRAVAAAAPAGAHKHQSASETRDFIMKNCGVLRVGDPRALAAGYFRHVLPVDLAEEAVRISPRPLLLLHGERDHLVPADVSRRIYAAAGRPKRLMIFRGTGHSFIDQRERLARTVGEWFKKNL